MGFDPGTISTLGTDCVEFRALSDERVYLIFSYGSVQTMNTVYLMGSVMNNDDLIGAELQVYNSNTGTVNICAILDGSGFYSCGMQGTHILI